MFIVRRAKIKTGKLLDDLSLNRKHVDKMLTELIPTDSEAVTYTHSEHSIKVNIFKLGARYFAKLSCCFLADLDDKQAFIKNAVEFAIREKELPVTFRDIALGGVISNEGRLTAVANIFGFKAKYHAYTVFKTPGEDAVAIEDPRTGIFETAEKLQSRFDNQICGFAATALLYCSYDALKKRSSSTPRTAELFTGVYNTTKVRALIQSLENKVGKEVTTKEAVVAEFPKQLLNLQKPAAALDEEKSSSSAGPAAR